MVSNVRKENAGKKKKIKVLNLNKETVRDLTGNEAKGVKGGTTTCIIGVGSRGQPTSNNTILTSTGMNSVSMRGGPTGDST